MAIQYQLEPNSDGTFTVLIYYDARSEVEFGLDFLAPDNLRKYRDNILQTIQESYRDVSIKAAKILISGVLIATIPLAAALSASAESKYSMSYLNGGTVTQQIAYVDRTNNSLNTVAPSYFDLNTDGSLKLNTPSTQLINAMHNQDIRVVPYLSNHWDRTSGVNAVTNYKKLAADIAAAVEKHNLDGVNVDIENITHAHKNEYTALVAELRRLIPKEKTVSVAVAANPNGWTTGWHGSYDYAALAQHADYLVLMTYDEHWNGGSAGPVASQGFVEKSIQYALKYAPADKIVMGIPFFGRIWSDNGQFNGYGLNASTVDTLLKKHSGTVTFDTASQSPKAVITVKTGDPASTVGGTVLKPGTYTVWYENERSFEAKLALVQKYKLKGAGSWALGQEPGTIWSNYSAWLNGSLSSGDSDSKPSTSTPSVSTPSAATQGIALRVNSKKAIVNESVTAIDSNGSFPYILNGRTMVPLRFTSEKLGATVKWTANNQPVTIQYGNITVTLTVGNRTITVTQNGKSNRITLDQAPVLRNGRIFVPLRAVAENLGYIVKYDNTTRTIVMTKTSLTSAQLTSLFDNAKNKI